MLDANYLLTDEQMAQFIVDGYLVLRNDLPQELHRKVMADIHYALTNEGNPGNNILPRVPDIGKFFDTPTVRGALMSVLGPDYYMHPHRHCHYNRPGNQTPGGGQWHKDGYWSAMRSHRPWWAMIFYYTQDITEGMGPTAILPGSHYYDRFPGADGRELLPTGKAGTMVLVHFDLWHRASVNSSTVDRYMLKFQFVRLQVPTYPSWNNRMAEMPLPATGAPVAHRNLWQDVWRWLRGGEGTIAAEAVRGDNDGAGGVDRLIADLCSADALVRGRAADELGLLAGAAEAAAAPLAALLDDVAEHVAWNAAYALGHLGAGGAEALLAALRQGSDIAAYRAAYGLPAAGPAAVPGLVQALAHAEEKRRALAAFALGMLGGKASLAVPALIARLGDDSEAVRRNAAEALGMIAQPAREVVPALAGVLTSSVGNEPAQHAMTTAADLYNQAYIRDKVGYAAALSLLRTGKLGDAGTVVRALARALDSSDRYVKAYAAEALTHLRTDEAVDALISFYRTARWCPDTHKASAF